MTVARKKVMAKKSGTRVRPVKKKSAKPASKPSIKAHKPKHKAPPKAVKQKKAAQGRPKMLKPSRSAGHKKTPAAATVSRKPAPKPAPPPPSPPPRLLRQTKTTAAALALMEKGIEYIYKKEFKKARAELKTLLETYPSEAEILARARSYIRICDREEAVQKKQSVSTDQLYALGVLEHNKSNYDEAISYFLQSLGQHPDADYIYYSLAASMALKGDAAGSLQYLRKAIELNEDSRVYAKNDPDFSALQGDSRFADLVGPGQSSSIQP